MRALHGRNSSRPYKEKSLDPYFLDCELEPHELSTKKIASSEKPGLFTAWLVFYHI